MTVKEFFKSTTFKCLITLLCVLLVSGILLTIAYGFLEVTDEERMNRAISKIYGRDISVTALDVTDEQSKQGQATIIEAYKDEEGNYLIKSKGTGGFGGTVTCWVLVNIDSNSVSKVSKVIVETSDGETQLNLINYLDKFADTSYTDGYIYSTDNGFITAGSTLTSTAINNSVNGAVAFVRYVCLGVEAEDPYKDFAFHDYIDMEKTTWSVDGDEVTYSIVTLKNGPANAFEMTVTVGADKTIKAYEITVYGSTDNSYQNTTKEDYDSKINTSLYIGKDVDYFKSIIGEDGSVTGNDNFASNNIETGATKSNYLCLAAGAFATANYDYVRTLVYFTDYIDMEKTTWSVDGDEVTYSIVTLKNAPANAFEMTVTVSADKTIKAYEITEYGSTDNSYQNTSKDDYNNKINISLYIGKGVDYFKSIIGNDGSVTGNDNFASNNIETGATKSNYLCLAAGAFATANYDYCLNNQSGGAENE